MKCDVSILYVESRLGEGGNALQQALCEVIGNKKDSKVFH